MKYADKCKLDLKAKEEWKDWCTNTYGYTIGSIKCLDTKDILEYINKIHINIKNETSSYSEEYLNECIIYIELISKGSYEYIDLLENIGAYYPHKEEFIECLKRLSETEQ